MAAGFFRIFKLVVSQLPLCGRVVLAGIVASYDAGIIWRGLSATVAAASSASASAAKSEALAKNVANAESASRLETAKKKLDRLAEEAQARKAKYAGVGMANVAKVMMKRAMDG